jgi:hypothetical protein
MFRSRWLPNLIGRAFAEIPDVPIYKWAEGAGDAPSPFRLRKSPEPTYRSGRTPWVRRGADLIRKPWHDGRRIRRFGAKKSSQSGYTEGTILNPIRWTAKHRPRNCIISLDSLKEVGNISDRLVPTLEDLGPDIFTGKADDLTKFKLTLVGMDVWFDGSFSAGGFSNKYASWVFNDEVDLYGEVSDEGDTLENYYSRVKEADDGYQTVISKPAQEDGPIDSFFNLGNQEFYNVACPHHGCRERQALEWSRVEYQHCKSGGAWDIARMLDETFYRCRKCGQAIRDEHKLAMNAEGIWVPTAKGDPEIVTQHMSDIYSVAKGSTLGHLAKEFVRAEEADSRALKMTFQQQRLGLAWKQKIHKVEESDLLKLRTGYRRGVIPEAGCALAIGMDIGLYTNTRWVVYAFSRTGEMWLIDWGGHPALNVAPATGPSEVINVMRNKRYECSATGAKQVIQFAFLDARYRGDEVYETCLLAPRQLFPVMGLRGRAARSINYRQVMGRPEGFGQINFINEDAMYDLYIDRIKMAKPPGLHWPENVEDIIVREHGAERLIRDKKTNKIIWEDEHKRPNHYGDSTKIVLTGIDWLIGGKRTRIITDIQEFENEREMAASINFGTGAFAA